MILKTAMALACTLVLAAPAAWGCEGHGAQASDCAYYYGPVGQGPYANQTSTTAGSTSQPTANQRTQRSTRRGSAAASER